MRFPNRTRRPAVLVLAIALVSLLLLNLNGREIGGYDSQPTKFAARELALRGTLTLDEVVRNTPAYVERLAFARARDGHYRSAYPVVPSIIAAGPAWLLGTLGLLDLDAPLAPTVVAKLTASLLVTLAVAFAYVIARQRTAAGAAGLIAIAYGLGTNIWPVAGQTLGGHETVAFAMTAALVCLANPAAGPTGWRGWIGASMLALAGAARPQVAPAIGVLLVSFVVRNARPRDWLPVSVVVLGAAIVAGFNVMWFGHPLGAVPTLEAAHPSVHAATGTFTVPWPGAIGLLFSPSRGLLIFSPIVLACLPGIRPAVREGIRGALVWSVAAAIAQFLFYASYTVWWGGHTYGPRYCLDLLPLLLPVAAAGIPAIARSSAARFAALAALGWSVCLAATGAFAFPAERWNTDPDDVDRHHERLWDWHDPQFVRCWKRGPSPQNFDLFSRDAFGRPSGSPGAE